MFKKLALFVMFLVMPALACNFSTANIPQAFMARDDAGNDKTTTFNADDTFYLIVELANASDTTTVKVVWTAVAVEGADPDTFLDEVELESGDDVLIFDLANDSLWPAGTFKADIYLNDELDRTLEFEVN